MVSDKDIYKLLGKRKIRSILRRWVVDQVNVCLEIKNSHISFDSTIDGYGLPKNYDEDHDYLVDELFEFVGNKI